MTMHLYLLQPDIVLQAQVNQASFDYPIDELAYDSVTTGSYLDIKNGMTVLFGSVAGADDLGRQRIRAGEGVPAGATTMYIGRSSRGINDGEVDLSDNAYITILDDYRVWSKIPYITDDGLIYKDAGLLVYDQTDDIPPKANGGAPMAGTIGAGGSLSVSFSASESYAVSGTVTSVLWNLIDGTLTDGTLASENITATFPAGFRWVELIALSSNGDTHTTRIPVYARDPDSDTTIQNFTIESHTIRKEGQRISVRVLSDIPVSSYPDNTLVMIWENEPESSTDRSHMRFTGWHTTDPADIRAERTGTLKNTVLDCVDVAGRLDMLPGFPISIEGKASPSSWLEMSDPNMDKYIDYILRWHSTALEVAHVTLSGTGNEFPFVILGSDAQSLWDQVARRCQSLVPDYVLGCDTKGRICVNPDPMIQTTRASTVQAAITEDDYSAVSFTHQRPPRVHWLRSEAVLAHATEIQALFSVAPDTSPGQGENEQTNGEQLAKSQSDLNAAEGNRYGRLNAQESNFNISTTWEAAEDIEPSALTWVSLNMPASVSPQRGLTLANERGLVHEMNIRYQQTRTGLVRNVDLIWEREASGTAAITYEPPNTDFEPVYEPPPDDGFDPTPPTGMGDGFGTVYVMNDNNLGRTRDLSATSPTWSDITPASAGTLWDFILDPWNPTTTAYITASTGIWKSTNLTNAAPTFTNILTASAIETAVSESSFTNAYKIICSINQDGYVAFFFQTGTYNLRCAYSANGGTSWNFSLVAAFASGGWHGGADYVPHLVSGNIRLYATYNLAGSGADGYLIRSDDGGASWNTPTFYFNASGGQQAWCPQLHCPYEDNEDGNTTYLYHLSAYMGVARTTDGGTTVTKLINSGAGLSVRRGMLEMYTQDSEIGYRWLRTGGGVVELYTTDDEWVSESAASLTGAPTNGHMSAAGGFPANGSQFYAVLVGTVDKIVVSTDAGENWTDKTGDWATSVGALGTSPGVIVPVWVVE